MNTQEIVSQLRDELDRLQKAIAALERMVPSTPRRGRKPGRKMSAEARGRIGLAMKKRWAERKRKQKK